MNTMSIFSIIQYILSTATIIVGLINFFRNSDVMGVKMSGLISFFLGLLFILFLYFDYPISIREQSSQLYVLSTLSISIYFTWSLFTSMLPVISMRPAWFNFKNVLAVIHPLIIVLFVTIINRFFVLGHASFVVDSESYENPGRPDLILRVIWFIVTLVYAIWHIYWPFSVMPKAHTRRPTHFLFINQLMLLLALICFVLTVQGEVWIRIYQTVLILITLFSSVSFFWKDAYSVVKKKQLKMSTAEEPEEGHKLSLDIAAKKLRLERASQMLQLFQTNDLLKNPKFSLQDISDMMKLDKSSCQDIILLLGYAGFNEMVVSMRCDRFKQLAHSQIKMGRNPNIREIMSDIGFVSYKNFSNHFSTLNETNPEEYIDWLKSNIK